MVVRRNPVGNERPVSSEVNSQVMQRPPCAGSKGLSRHVSTHHQRCHGLGHFWNTQLCPQLVCAPNWCVPPTGVCPQLVCAPNWCVPPTGVPPNWCVPQLVCPQMVYVYQTGVCPNWSVPQLECAKLVCAKLVCAPN